MGIIKLQHIQTSTAENRNRFQPEPVTSSSKEGFAHAEPGRGSYTFTIDVDNVDTRFGMLAKLVGINGENVHHIQDVTKAKVWINREAGQPTAIKISADSRDSLNHTKQLANGLLSVMFAVERAPSGLLRGQG